MPHPNPSKPVKVKKHTREDGAVKVDTYRRGLPKIRIPRKPKPGVVGREEMRYQRYSDRYHLKKDAPIEAIDGIGPKTAQLLRENGIKTVGDLDRAIKKEYIPAKDIKMEHADGSPAYDKKGKRIVIHQPGGYTDLGKLLIEIKNRGQGRITKEEMKQLKMLDSKGKLKDSASVSAIEGVGATQSKELSKRGKVHSVGTTRERIKREEKERKGITRAEFDKQQAGVYKKINLSPPEKEELDLEWEEYQEKLQLKRLNR